MEPPPRAAIGFLQNSSGGNWRDTRWGGCPDCLASKEPREGGLEAGKPPTQPSEATAEDELCK